MDFASVRIITDNFDSMVEFYENVTGVTADRPAPVFAELRYPSCTLALGHTSTAALFNNAARPANNQTAILEWVVDDVDALVFESSATHAQGISKGRTRLLPRSLDRSASVPNAGAAIGVGRLQAPHQGGMRGLRPQSPVRGRGATAMPGN